MLPEHRKHIGLNCIVHGKQRVPNSSDAWLTLVLLFPRYHDNDNDDSFCNILNLGTNVMNHHISHGIMDWGDIFYSLHDSMSLRVMSFDVRKNKSIMGLLIFQVSCSMFDRAKLPRTDSCEAGTLEGAPVGTLHLGVIPESWNCFMNFKLWL